MAHRKLTEDERRRNKIERDREYRRRNKSAINAKDRERKKGKAVEMTKEEKIAHNEQQAKIMRARRAALSPQEHEGHLEAKRRAYEDMDPLQKDEYLMKKREAIKTRRENQTERERQEEHAANSIRNTLTRTCQGWARSSQYRERTQD